MNPNAITHFNMMIKGLSSGNTHTTLLAMIIHHVVFLDSMSIHCLMKCKPFITQRSRRQKWEVLMNPHAIANFNMMIKSSSGGNAHTTLRAMIIHHIEILESVSIHRLLMCKPFITQRSRRQIGKC